MTIEMAQREELIRLRDENKLLRSACKKYLDQAEVHRCSVDVLKAMIDVLAEKKKIATSAYDILTDLVCGVR